jgi:hypothetical protein
MRIGAVPRDSAGAAGGLRQGQASLSRTRLASAP